MYVIRESGMEFVKQYVIKPKITYTASRDYIRLTSITYQTFGLNKQPKLNHQLGLFMVELSGVEPLASSLRTRRSTN